MALVVISYLHLEHTFHTPSIDRLWKDAISTLGMDHAMHHHHTEGRTVITHLNLLTMAGRVHTIAGSCLRSKKEIWTGGLRHTKWLGLDP